MSGGFPRVPGVTKEYQQTTSVDPQSRGEGWGGKTTFAGIWLSLVGALNMIWGIVALTQSEELSEKDLVWENLAAWGWIILIVGAIQLAIGLLVLRRKGAGRPLGVLIAAIGIILNFFTIGAHPLWSVIALAGCGLVIWALTADEV